MQEFNQDKSSKKSDFHCTGWGIIDGILYCVRKVKEWRQDKQSESNE